MVRYILSCMLAVSVTAGVMTGTIAGAFAAETTPVQFDQQYNAERDAFSEEYMSTDFYTKLNEAKENYKSASTMEKAVAVALSQEGYKNYSTEGIDIEEAKKEGLLWTGAVKRMNDDLTGNTEYTRWAERYILNSVEDYQYRDIDWCAVFISWCLYQAGYYDEDKMKKYYYSYYADPRIEFSADTWIEAFNLEQENVWYTSAAVRKLEAYNWNRFVNTNVDPYEIPYKPGGLLFFTWDGSGRYFNHVGMVVDYDPETHILTYTNGNADGEVVTRQMDLDNEEEFLSAPFLKNSQRILAYGEYDKILPLDKKEITADNTQITWDKHDSQGFTIETDSASKTVNVYLDGEYMGSNIESNMLLRYGVLSIGRSELISISNGVHSLELDFEDGSVELELTITNQKDLEPDNTVFLYNGKSSEQLVIQTTSESENVSLYIGETKIADSTDESISVSDGVITVSTEILNGLDNEKANEIKVSADDGEFGITVYRIEDETESEYNYVIEDTVLKNISYGSFYPDHENIFSTNKMKSPEAGNYKISAFRKNENNVSVYCTETALTVEDESMNIRFGFDADNNTLSIDKIAPVVFEAEETDFEWTSGTDNQISVNITPAPEKAALFATDGDLLADENNGLVIDGNTVIIGADILERLPVNETVPMNLIVYSGIDSSEFTLNISVIKNEPQESSEPESSEPETSEQSNSEDDTSYQESSDTETSDQESSEPESSEPETSEQGKSEDDTSHQESSDTETSDRESSEQESTSSETPSQESSEPSANQPQNIDYPQTGSASPVGFMISMIISAVAAVLLSLKKKINVD